MHKAINSEAMKPTRKPVGIVKLEEKEKNRLTDYSTSHKKDVFSPLDAVKQTQTEPKSQSPFKDHPLYSQQQDLASSFSFSEENQEFSYQKLLFSKFLQSQEKQWISFMHDMNKISQEKLLAIVKVGDTEKSIYSNRIIGHFFGVWLLQMGYKDPETKRRVIMSVQYLFPKQQQAVAEIASLIYEKMFQGYLPEHLQLRVLFELCKRGWEYFSFFLGRFIKLLKKHKSIRGDSFIEEVEKIVI